MFTWPQTFPQIHELALADPGKPPGPAAYLFRDVDTVRNTLRASAVLIADLPFVLLFLGDPGHRLPSPKTLFVMLPAFLSSPGGRTRADAQSRRTAIDPKPRRPDRRNHQWSNDGEGARPRFAPCPLWNGSTPTTSTPCPRRENRYPLQFRSDADNGDDHPCDHRRRRDRQSGTDHGRADRRQHAVRAPTWTLEPTGRPMAGLCELQVIGGALDRL